MPDFSNTNINPQELNIMNMKKSALISELFCLRKLIQESPPVFRLKIPEWQAEFARISRQLVEMELAAYTKRFYPTKYNGH